MLSTMKYKGWIVLLCVTICVSSPGFARSEFIRGETWNKIDAKSKSWYIIGLIDSWMTYNSLVEELQKRGYENDGNFNWYRNALRCIIEEGMTSSQLTAMTDKYIRDHPEEWQYSVPGLFVSVLLIPCKDYMKK